MAAGRERNTTAGAFSNKAMAGLLGLAVLSAGCSVESSKAQGGIVAGQDLVPPACSAAGGEAGFTLRIAMGVSVETTSALLGEAGPDQQAAAWQELSIEVGRVVVEHYSGSNPVVSYRVGHDGEAPFAYPEANAASDLLTAELGRVTGFPVTDGASYPEAQDRIATIYIGSLEETQSADCSLV